MGTHLREISGSYPKNTNITGFRWFSKLFASLCAFDKSSLSIGNVNPFMPIVSKVLKNTLFRYIQDLPGRRNVDQNLYDNLSLFQIFCESINDSKKFP